MVQILLIIGLWSWPVENRYNKLFKYFSKLEQMHNLDSLFDGLP